MRAAGWTGSDCMASIELNEGKGSPYSSRELISTGSDMGSENWIQQRWPFEGWPHSNCLVRG
jgi:hypothetical protein